MRLKGKVEFLYNCQYCTNTEITEVLYLGALPPVNDLRSSSDELGEVGFFPLPFCHCENCSLTQIGVRLKREVIFPRTYPYLSGVTKSLVKNFSEQAEKVVSYLSLAQTDLVVDIGSNDGSLLNNYLKYSRVLGIEPSQAADIANSNGITTLNTYFDKKSMIKIKDEYGKARLVTACNVFAHIDDIPELLSNIGELLAEDGIFLTESHYLLNLVETLQFDTIYHEHLRYYTVTFLEKMFREHGLEIFRVENIPTHGGSIRVWASKPGSHLVTETVEEFLLNEDLAAISKLEKLQEFANRVISWRNNFRLVLSELISSGARIGGIGAPSRASTLIAFTGLTELDLLAVGEVQNSAKIGKYMPGTRIPVIPESELLSQDPTHLLILSWHIEEPIIKSLRDMGYKGSFIVPLPSPRVLQ